MMYTYKKSNSGKKKKKKETPFVQTTFFILFYLFCKIVTNHPISIRLSGEILQTKYKLLDSKISYLDQNLKERKKRKVFLMFRLMPASGSDRFFFFNFIFIFLNNSFQIFEFCQNLNAFLRFFSRYLNYFTCVSFLFFFSFHYFFSF